MAVLPVKLTPMFMHPCVSKDDVICTIICTRDVEDTFFFVCIHIYRCYNHTLAVDWLIGHTIKQFVVGVRDLAMNPS